MASGELRRARRPLGSISVLMVTLRKLRVATGEPVAARGIAESALTPGDSPRAFASESSLGLVAPTGPVCPARCVPLAQDA
jgi:hypothetical protein